MRLIACPETEESCERENCSVRHCALRSELAERRGPANFKANERADMRALFRYWRFGESTPRALEVHQKQLNRRPKT
jgi:hypothetical protein